MPDEEIDSNRLSPWLLRIELDRNAKEDKKLSIQDVVDMVNKEFSDLIQVIATDDNADNLIIRMRLIKERDQVGNDNEQEQLLNLASILLDQSSLKGIKGINKVFIREGKVHSFES